MTDELSKEQVRKISQSILVSDILSYIQEHNEEFLVFLEEENGKN